MDEFEDFEDDAFADVDEDYVDFDYRPEDSGFYDFED